jgi:hypothetical protein
VVTGDPHKTVVGSDAGSTANTKWSRGGEHAQSHVPERTHALMEKCLCDAHTPIYAGGVFPSTMHCSPQSLSISAHAAHTTTARESTAAAGLTLPSNELIVHAALMMLGVQAG